MTQPVEESRGADHERFRLDHERSRLNREKLTDDDADLLYDIIDITDRILTEHAIDYTIEGGTLLGHQRCGGLLPHDNDGDFDVLEADLPKVRALADEFAKYDLVLIETPGWGFQVSHQNSPDLEPGMWTNIDGSRTWTSKWPFLDLIAIAENADTDRYILAGDVALKDYPNYYLTQSDWKTPKERVNFGHLKLKAIAGEDARLAYLDRHYPNWRTHIEMVMDHRTNVYFDRPILCPVTTHDLTHRPRRGT